MLAKKKKKNTIAIKQKTLLGNHKRSWRLNWLRGGRDVQSDKSVSSDLLSSNGGGDMTCGMMHSHRP